MITNNTTTTMTANKKDIQIERTNNMKAYTPYTLDSLLNNRTFTIERKHNLFQTPTISTFSDPNLNWNNNVQVYTTKSWKVNKNTTLKELAASPEYKDTPIRTATYTRPDQPHIKRNTRPLHEYLQLLEENYPVNKSRTQRLNYLNKAFVLIRTAIEERTETLKEEYRRPEYHDPILTQAIELVANNTAASTLENKRDLYRALVLQQKLYTKEEVLDILNNHREAYLALAATYELEVKEHRIDFKEQTFMRLLPNYSKWDENAPKYTPEDFLAPNIPGTTFGYIPCSRYITYTSELDEDVTILEYLYLAAQGDEFLRVDKYGEKAPYDMTPAPSTDEEIQAFRNRIAQEEYDHLIGHRDFGEEEAEEDYYFDSEPSDEEDPELENALWDDEEN